MPLPDRDVKSLAEFAFTHAEQHSPWHITRHAMYSALSGRFADQDDPMRVVLSISRSKALMDTLGFEQTERFEAGYPAYDMADLGLPDDAYDFVVSDQVIEHVAGGPVACFEETARVLAPGGWMVHATCLMNEIHQSPLDFWRLTPFALRMLAERCGLEVHEATGWGNRRASKLIEMGFRKRVVPIDERNPIHKIATENDENHPIVTWVVARKPPVSRLTKLRARRPSSREP